VAAADAETLAPGAAWTRSVVLFGGVGSDDCGEFEPEDSGAPDTGPTDTDPQDSDPPDTDPPDSDPPDDDSALPTDTASPHLAGGLASCGCTGGQSAGLVLMLLTTGLAARRRRRDGGEA
jgi:hypothetical protein